MQLPRALDLPKQFVKQALDDEVPDLAAGLAYRFLFAVFPFGIFLAALAAFVAHWLGIGDPSSQILGALGDNLPPDVAKQIAPQLETVLGSARPELLSIGALGALWAATGGISSLMTAMNKAYDVQETRSFFRKMAMAVALTLIGSAGILVAFVTIVGGSVITQQAITALGVAPGTWSILSLIRFPIVLLLVALAVAVLFRFGPNVAVSFRWTIVGGIAFAILWLVATVVFGLYVANFGSYANTYGALGGVVILMLWFYLTALLLLLAAELTSMLAKHHEPERVEARRTETKATKAAQDVAKQATEGAGPAPGAVAAAGTSPSGDDDGGAGDRRRAPEGPRPRHAGEPRFAAPSAASGVGIGSGAAASPITRIPRADPDAHPTTSFRPSRLFAVVVVGAGAVAGALAGLLAGDDDEAAAP